MERKRFIAISAIALVMTGSTAAYGALTETGVFASGTEEVSVQLVTKPVEIIDSPVKIEVTVSGPVQIQVLQTGPIFSSGAPEVGTVEWLLQEKADINKREEDAKATVTKIQTEAERKQAELEAEIARLEKIAFHTETLNETLVLVKNQVGKTPWVFSGSTPGAWDCSGLVRWTYANLGIDLLHSASAQRFAGEFVTKPKIGDLVSFNHRSYGSAYHIGIYIGPDEMIHAGGKPGDRTEIRSIRGWAKDNGGSGIKYTRIVETNN
jgi:cell wall-associated NlpC family hydrolase